jgi:ACR3 family arsenite efflux pump ArsB
MKTYEHEFAHSHEHSKSIWRYSSGSFLQSLATALVLGTMAALIAIAVSAALYYRHVAWYIVAAAGPLTDTLVVICLATIALEQARKRSIAGPLKTQPKGAAQCVSD